MSDRSRTAVKLGVLAAPAVALTLALALGGEQMRTIGYRIFSQRGHRVTVGMHLYDLPGKEWEEKVVRFVQAFVDRFARDNPFQNADASRKKLKRPLRPLSRALTIVITRDRDTFEKEARVRTGADLPFSGGFFNRSRHSITLDADPHTPDTIRPPLAHELTHAIMFYSYEADPEWSPWLAEGVAQWSETENADKQLGGENLKRLGDARDLRPGGLVLLLNAGHDRFLGRENRWYYDAAYALVAFLLSSPDLRERFLDYFDEESAPGGRPSEALFREKIGDPAEIEPRLMQWLRQQN